MNGREIEDFYTAHKALYQFLIEKEELSFAVYTSNNFRRSFVLAVASYFETIISDIVRTIPVKHASSNSLLCGLIESKVLSRQYHTFFDWDKSNANKFFKMFGTEFASSAADDVRKNTSLNQSILDFIELGATRNRLVHINYITYDVDKSPDDIYQLYKSAMEFIPYLRKKFEIDVV